MAYNDQKTKEMETILDSKTLDFCLDDNKFERNFPIIKENPPGKPEPKPIRHIKYGDNDKLIMRQPFKILTDIWGVLTSHRFKDKLYEYIDQNLENFLHSHFHDGDVQIYLERLSKRTKEDLEKYPDMPILNLHAEDTNLIVKNIVNNLNFRREHSDRKHLMRSLDDIFQQIWNHGYSNKKLCPHLFPDVMDNFKKWHSDPFYIKIYTFASGPLEIQKLFLSVTTEGNLTEWITSYFDAQHRFKYDPSKYRGILASLSERDPQNLFYLTDSPRKGREARKTGMTVFIVQRDGNRQYKPEDLEPFPIIKSFDQFEFTQFGAGCC